MAYLWRHKRAAVIWTGHERLAFVWIRRKSILNKRAGVICTGHERLAFVWIRGKSILNKRPAVIWTGHEWLAVIWAGHECPQRGVGVGRSVK